MNKIIKSLALKLGWAFCILSRIVSLYKNHYFNTKVKGNGKIGYPYIVNGYENIECGESVHVGVGACILCTRAKVIFKGHFVSGPNLTIITGDHMPIIGKYLDEVTDQDKDEFDIKHEFDQDVVIEEDVWAGANVTILKGVTIGRGCIIAAGAVVTKDMPPYHIVGGVPAKAIRKRWTDEQIREHERLLIVKHK